MFFDFLMTKLVDFFGKGFLNHQPGLLKVYEALHTHSFFNLFLGELLQANPIHSQSVFFLLFMSFIVLAT